MQRARQGFRREGTLTAGLPPASLRSCKRRKGHQQGQGPAHQRHRAPTKCPSKGTLKAAVWASEGPKSARTLQRSQEGTGCPQRGTKCHWDTELEGSGRNGCGSRGSREWARAAGAPHAREGQDKG